MKADKKFITWDEIHKHTLMLSNALLTSNKNWNIIVAITRGGLVPAGILSQTLNIKHIETICLSSYSDETHSQSEINILKKFETDREDVLVVDDLIETGKTFQIAKQMMPNATFSCLYSKTERSIIIDYFVKKYDPNRWLVFPWEDNNDN